MNNGVDYTIYLQPIYLEVTCPHCKAKLTLFDGDGVDFDECYSDESEGISINCDECWGEIHLGDFKETVE
ncbi:TPA: hypothetical protein RF358_001317 [Listeria monocytogenes]|uniref:Uncharacterized protein n=1 Tax=Listeria monocytogenes TaxID=1639 RepID=A0AAN2ZW67_LISMN|nr:hypothetical protein [Listeria monocytogenes]EAC6665027.1 hypothetical protein [Listeria monocytogenes]EAD0970065.1 hypothetical protein [Listeria monocytogenes]EAD0973451.1 hypothetical protein [Listeria monocytogenes]EAD5897983.1 hypothetical protein [Listeria monocytogenes]EAD6168561.1 hypothetical protein [Listeria monocytogenes]